ncbi:hypothetical protein Q7P37_008763 [Cladosporium fusiforme]
MARGKPNTSSSYSASASSSSAPVLRVLAPKPPKMAHQAASMEAQPGVFQNAGQFQGAPLAQNVVLQGPAAPFNAMHAPDMGMHHLALPQQQQRPAQPALLPAAPFNAPQFQYMGLQYQQPQEQQQYAQPAQLPAAPVTFPYAQDMGFQYGQQQQQPQQQLGMPAQLQAAPINNAMFAPDMDAFTNEGMTEADMHMQPLDMGLYEDNMAPLPQQYAAVPAQFPAAPAEQQAPLIGRDEIVEILKGYVLQKAGGYDPNAVGKSCRVKCVDRYLAGDHKGACEMFRRRAQRTRSQQEKRREEKAAKMQKQ